MFAIIRPEQKGTFAVGVALIVLGALHLIAGIVTIVLLRLDGHRWSVLSGVPNVVAALPNVLIGAFAVVAARGTRRVFAVSAKGFLVHFLLRHQLCAFTDRHDRARDARGGRLGDHRCARCGHRRR